MHCRKDLSVNMYTCIGVGSKEEQYSENLIKISKVSYNKNIQVKTLTCN